MPSPARSDDASLADALIAQADAQPAPAEAQARAFTVRVLDLVTAAFQTGDPKNTLHADLELAIAQFVDAVEGT